jgi:hypothetical protein
MSDTTPGPLADDLYAANMAAWVIRCHLTATPVLSSTEPPSVQNALDALATIGKVLASLPASTPTPPQPEALREAAEAALVIFADGDGHDIEYRNHKWRCVDGCPAHRVLAALRAALAPSYTTVVTTGHSGPFDTPHPDTEDPDHA